MAEKSVPPSPSVAAQDIAAEDPKSGKRQHGAWKVGEEHVLPHNNLKIVFPGLMLTVFLSAMDQVRHTPIYTLHCVLIVSLPYRPS